MYGEESKDPKRIIPRATMISVLGVGIFYVFISWMAIAGTGPQKSVELAQDSGDGGQHLLRSGAEAPTATGPSRCSSCCW